MKKALLLIFLSFAISSCLRKEKYSNVEIEGSDVGFAIPIANSKMTVEDIAYNIHGSNDLFTAGSDGSIIFVYHDTLQFPRSEELIKIPNQPAYQKSYGFNNAPPLPLEGQTFEEEYQDNFTFLFENDAYIEYANLKAGYLNLMLQTELKHDLEVTVVLNSLVKNGVPYSKTFPMEYSGRSPTVIGDIVDLKGYQLMLKHGNNNNTFNYTIHLKATASGRDQFLEDIDFKLNFEQLHYSLMYGNPGEVSVNNETSQLDIKLFQAPIEGDIYLDDPRINFTLANSFGMPVSLNIDHVISNNYLNNESVTLSAPFIPGPNNLNYPRYSQRGAFAKTLYEAHKYNSNVRDIFNTSPSEIDYRISARFGKEGGSNYFVKDLSTVELQLKAEIPAKGRVSLYSLSDTIRGIELPARDVLEIADINFAKIRLNVENSLPLGAVLQGYWLAPNGQVLDSLFINERELIAAGNRNTNDGIIPTVKETVLEVEAPAYDHIRKADRLVLRGWLQSSDSGERNVRFYYHDFIHVRLSILSKAKLNFE
ncbi:hypothetical protein RCC89_17070 [Cytophagaceae bacterium ABcell3]|nr:hypothetical protein RCC89_17070 [Cytophagaceae bacterium ABcell3]